MTGDNWVLCTKGECKFHTTSQVRARDVYYHSTPTPTYYNIGENTHHHLWLKLICQIYQGKYNSFKEIGDFETVICKIKYIYFKMAYRDLMNEILLTSQFFN